MVLDAPRRAKCLGACGAGCHATRASNDVLLGAWGPTMGLGSQRAGSPRRRAATRCGSARAILIGAVLWGIVAPSLGAQEMPPPQQLRNEQAAVPLPRETPAAQEASKQLYWSTPPMSIPRLGVLGINVGIGSGTALLKALMGKRPVWPAIWRGAVGGGVMTAGMEVAGRTHTRHRLLGVQTVALGASIARNAGDGRPMFSRVTLPFFPFIAEVGVTSRERAGENRRARRPYASVRLSAVGLTGLAIRRASGLDMSVDWRETMTSGYLVYKTQSLEFGEGAQCRAGHQCLRAGDYLLGTAAYDALEPDQEAVRRTLAHEAMHATQHVRDAVLFGIPVSEAITNRTGRVGRFVGKLVVFDFVLPLSLASIISGHANGTAHDAWYEVEARAIAPGSAGTFDAPAALTMRGRN